MTSKFREIKDLFRYGIDNPEEPIEYLLEAFRGMKGGNHNTSLTISRFEDKDAEIITKGPSRRFRENFKKYVEGDDEKIFDASRHYADDDTHIKIFLRNRNYTLNSYGGFVSNRLATFPEIDGSDYEIGYLIHSCKQNPSKILLKPTYFHTIGSDLKRDLVGTFSQKPTMDTSDLVKLEGLSRNLNIKYDEYLKGLGSLNSGF